MGFVWLFSAWWRLFFAGETRFRGSRWNLCCSFLLLEIVICRCDEEKRVQVEFVMPFSAGGGRLLQVEYGFLRVE